MTNFYDMRNPEKRSPAETARLKKNSAAEISKTSKKNEPAVKRAQMAGKLGWVELKKNSVQGGIFPKAPTRNTAAKNRMK